VLGQVDRETTELVQHSAYRASSHRRYVASKPVMKMVWLYLSMHLHTGADQFGNVIFRYSELPSQYHIDASIDVLCNGWEHYVPYRCL
jgi:hypothetical protein